VTVIVRRFDAVTRRGSAQPLATKRTQPHSSCRSSPTGPWLFYTMTLNPVGRGSPSSAAMPSHPQHAPTGVDIPQTFESGLCQPGSPAKDAIGGSICFTTCLRDGRDRDPHCHLAHGHRFQSWNPSGLPLYPGRPPPSCARRHIRWGAAVSPHVCTEGAEISLLRSAFFDPYQCGYCQRIARLRAKQIQPLCCMTVHSIRSIVPRLFGACANFTIGTNTAPCAPALTL